MNKSIVSVVIPVFDCIDYLERCIESVLEQTLNEIEIVLVDDGSTDGSDKLCDYYAEIDGRVKVIHQNNKGPVAARGMGIKTAIGQYIGFVDGDDYIEPRMLEVLKRSIEISGADFVHSGFFQDGVYFGPDNTNEIYINKENRLSLLRDFINGRRVLLKGITPSIWSKLFRKDFIERCYLSIPEIKYGEDVIFLFKCIMEASKIVLLNEAYYQYNVRGNSLSHTNDLCDSIENIGILGAEIKRMAKNEGYYEALKDSIDEYCYLGLKNIVKKYNEEIFIPKYRFSNIKDLRNKKIVIYGAGSVGKDYYIQINKYYDCNIVLWVDRNADECTYEFRKVQYPDLITEIDFDIVVIAQLNCDIANEICEQLIDMGVERRKIIWEKPEVLQ